MDFKSIIKEQKEEIETLERNERIIEREAFGSAKEFLKHPNILAVIGVRRCGKSVLSTLIAKSGKYGYINFDDERLSGIKAEELNKILQAFYGLYGDIDFIVLDEVQNVEKWELFANRLRRTKRVIITGSNSNLLAGELSTHLTGRHIDVMLFPFSFREFLETKQFRKAAVYTTAEKAEIIGSMEEYLRCGGFPEVRKFGMAIIPKIYEDIIAKDILLRYRIRKRNEIRSIARYLVTNFSEENSYTKLSKIFGVKHISTVSNWISYLESSFLIFKLERFSFKLKEQFLSPKKFYCIDNGIINSIAFGISDNKGKLMENCVAVELFRRKTYGFMLDVHYWKDYRQKEVDFVIKKGKEVEQIIQVTYANSRMDIKEREINSLLKCSDELRCRNLTIITWDYEDEEKVKNRKIIFIPLWKWLLQQ